MLTSASDYLFDYTSNDMPATLVGGKRVQILTGALANKTFKLIANALPGFDRTPTADCRLTTRRSSPGNAAGRPRRPIPSR